MRASFSSWCDEYYNLKMLLIGEIFRSKAILERRQAAVKMRQHARKHDVVGCEKQRGRTVPHRRSLVSAFVIRTLQNSIAKLARREISVF